MSTVYVSIGNSDDKLSQEEWSRFVNQVDSLVGIGAVQIYGRWLSRGDDRWQNACWCFQPFSNRIDSIKRTLTRYAEEFKQDSIAWAEAETEFLVPAINRD